MHLEKMALPILLDGRKDIMETEALNRILAYIAAKKQEPYASLALSYMLKDEYDPYALAADFLEAKPDEPLDMLECSMVLDILEELSDQGNAMATNDLGAFWKLGRGGVKDEAKAKDLFEKAAFLGSEQALENLGCIALEEKDYRQAFKYLVKGALLMQPVSYFLLAQMYERGYYVQKDEKQAFAMYYELFKSMNEESAQFLGPQLCCKIASMALNGIGTQKDPLLAADFLEDGLELLTVQPADMSNRQLKKRMLTMQKAALLQLAKDESEG